MTLSVFQDFTRAMREFRPSQHNGRRMGDRPEAARRIVQLIDPVYGPSAFVTREFAQHWCAGNVAWKYDDL